VLGALAPPASDRNRRVAQAIAAVLTSTAPSRDVALPRAAHHMRLIPKILSIACSSFRVLIHRYDDRLDAVIPHDVGAT
jgi:hypothetical protein